GLSMKEMQAIAFKCGSDVPFFIIRKPAVVSGKGQKIRPILRKRRLWYVIVVKKGIKIPTGDAYKWFDNENRLTERNSYSIYRSEFDSVVRGGLDPDCLALHNDFEGAVYGRYPALRGLRDDIVLHGASDALLSGSGSAVFGYFNDQTSAKKCYNAMRRRHRGSFICLVRSI
ncbi:MAG: hypothetical protein LLG37_09125, partial [Spirochaetia bacterium]|nr:hypothetical protein [Spirochaetia bacterium]